jgi:hypothetical protein
MYERSRGRVGPRKVWGTLNRRLSDHNCEAREIGFRDERLISVFPLSCTNATEWRRRGVSLVNFNPFKRRMRIITLS